MENSFDLFVFLKQKGYLKNPPHTLWWPNAGSFEVLVGAILVQNTRWDQAFKALDRLRKKGILNPLALSEIPLNDLLPLLNDVGFFNQKTTRIQKLCENLLKDFGDYENFALNVDREWLLAQKGVGNETCDSILCYGLLRDEMVADKYTYKLLAKYGYDLKEYDELKEWLVCGLLENYKKVCEIYGFEIPLNTLYARFHGKIVEYCKENKI